MAMQSRVLHPADCHRINASGLDTRVESAPPRTVSTAIKLSSTVVWPTIVMLVVCGMRTLQGSFGVLPFCLFGGLCLPVLIPSNPAVNQGIANKHCQSMMARLCLSRC
jgi:hypothetical protein